ncbi:MAG: HD domain-containing protein [Bacilli bacterium]|nr:HD domain-containing protein [Bacilli bacterium]
MRKKKRSILKINFIFIFFISITLAMSYALLSTSLNIQGIVSGNYEETPIIDKDSNSNLEVNNINENSWQEETRLKKSLVSTNNFAINSTMIDNLNQLIDNIRLINYNLKNINHKHFNLKNTPINLFNTIEKCQLPNNQNSFSKNDVLDIIGVANLKNIFYESISNVNYKLFSGSHVHGIHHAHKTSLFTFILANLLKLTNEETEILIYAGLLHDIGRSNDINDPNHGKKGADKINNLSIFINSLEKRNLLKFIIASHDLELNEDILVKKISKYNITNISSAIKMLLILKDSDALDRTRFTVYGNSSSKLDPSYLNYGFSYKLIDFAQALNNAYEKASISKDENNLKR